MFNIYANKYAPIDPLVPPCEINLIPIGYVGENQTRCLVFDLTDCIQKFGTGTWQISFVRPGDNACYICTNVEQLDNTAIWVITETDTAFAGYGIVQLMFFPTSGGIAKTPQYRTVTFDSNGIPGDAPDPYEGLLEQIAQLTSQATAAAAQALEAAEEASEAVENGISTERAQRIAADEDLQTQITSLKGLAGAPVMANTAAAMTNSSKIYVYTGSEAGYTFGHWYYYNGAQWVSGGVYQASAVETDKTLTVSDMAADAAVVGEKIDQCMAAFVTETITDSAIASFDDGADDVPVKDLVVNIEPVQSGSGDPSPTNVRPITGWTEANITRTGKNLLNLSSLEEWNNYYGLTIKKNDDGSFTLNGTATGTAYQTLPVYLKTGNYILSGCPSGGSSTTYSIYISGISVYDTGNGRSFTVTKDGTYNVIIPRILNATNCNNLVFKPMIRPASDADATYEPHNGNTYNVSFGSAGTVYGGTLDVTTGVLTMTWARYTISGLIQGYTSNYFYGSAGDKKYGATNIMADIYKTVDAAASAMPEYSIKGNAANKNIYIRDPRYTDVSTFKAAQGNQPIYFELANPISYQLTPTEIRTLLGSNNIFADTGSIASLEYRADTGLLIKKLTNAIVALGGNV